jgi:hypothetical protein
MPYRQSPPDRDALFRESVAWRRLRPILPLALAVQALAVAQIASETSTYGVLRKWVRETWRASQHGQAAPPMPSGAVGPNSTFATVVQLAVLALTVIGVLGWLRFSSSAIKVSKTAGYPNHRNAVTTGLLFFIPIAGPLVARSASAASLPQGHEARVTLGIGWALVAIAEGAWLALYVTVLVTPSAVWAWAVAIASGAAWVAAALVLPHGLEAVAADHATLDVRPDATHS